METCNTEEKALEAGIPESVEKACVAGKAPSSDKQACICRHLPHMITLCPLPVDRKFIKVLLAVKRDVWNKKKWLVASSLCWDLGRSVAKTIWGRVSHFLPFPLRIYGIIKVCTYIS
jgi:hypothetical protein